MGKTKKIRELSPAELAKAHVFPVKLTREQEEEEARRIMNEERRKSRENMTPEVQLQLSLSAIKSRMEEAIKASGFHAEQSFRHFLRVYIDALGIRQKDFAAAIDVTPAELSQLLNGHRKPSENILIRLEIHSANRLDALLWFRLLEKERAHALLTDTALRKKERRHVKRALSFAG